MAYMTANVPCLRDGKYSRSYCTIYQNISETYLNAAFEIESWSFSLEIQR